MGCRDSGMYVVLVVLVTQFADYLLKAAIGKKSYVCMYIWTYVCVFVVCMYVCVCVCCIYACLYVCMYVYI